MWPRRTAFVRNSHLRRSFKSLAILPVVKYLGLETFISPKKYDVSYLWTPSLEGALDYMEELGDSLSSIKKDLKLVKGKNNFGVIYNRNTSKEKAEKTAASHFEKFLKAFLQAPQGYQD